MMREHSRKHLAKSKINIGILNECIKQVLNFLLYHNRQELSIKGHPSPCHSSQDNPARLLQSGGSSRYRKQSIHRLKTISLKKDKLVQMRTNCSVHGSHQVGSIRGHLILLNLNVAFLQPVDNNIHILLLNFHFVEIDDVVNDCVGIGIFGSLEGIRCDASRVV